MNQIQIQTQAKKLLDEFAGELEKIKIKPKKEKLQVGGFREELVVSEPSGEFKNAMFGNAPSKEGDFIIAEKKKW